MRGTLVIVLALLATPAFAEDDWVYDHLTADGLVAACEERDRSCDAFFQGFLAGQLAEKPSSPIGCREDGAPSAVDMKRALLFVAARNRDSLSGLASHAAVSAYRQVFCLSDAPLEQIRARLMN